ncbi:MAG TPA: NAD(P)-binding protein [Candidatus Sulfopaludibacter sp.]|jgi:spermidine dehydrogenase|nr:NAD(P)-binding protein [Candidatus Sulfopaludibacter sp.]
MIRRDFLNHALLGAGAALLNMPAPAFADTYTGYAGTGDYARSNGDPWPVVQAGHKLRDAKFQSLPVLDTGELFDLIIVGGGLSGLSAAYYSQKAAARRCLILENHAMFGGHCKQNEFLIDGHRLIGPQASNDFGVPRRGSHNQMDDLFTELNIPREFQWAEWSPKLDRLRIPRDNYSHMDGIYDTQVDVGYCFNGKWTNNIFAHNLDATPFSDPVRRDLLKWRNTTGGSEQVQRHLDSITYRQYIESELGLSPEVTKFAEPVTGLICGATPDAVCARAAHTLVRPTSSQPGISFPGGNTTFARHLVKALIPRAIPGNLAFDDVLANSVDFRALDAPDAPTRLRLGATVVRVQHEAAGVSVVYEHGGKLYRSRARAAIAASAGWANRRILADLPPALASAYDDFTYAPALSVNVALRHWRFLYKLRAPAVRYFDGDFGWSCNIRQSMVAGSFAPPLDPDKPVVLTFYTGIYQAGRSAKEQGDIGRKQLLATTYAEYERRIRKQMTTLFAAAGFRATTDIAGIVLNRWGHARVVQPPGFYYGVDGKPSPRQIVEKGFGKIAIAHAELNGHQNATGALAQGKRAAEQLG